MRLLPLAAICFLFLWPHQTCHALHESDVGVVDWYKPFVGVPDYSSPATAPAFHRISSGQNTQSIILTATQNNVLGGLNPVNGSLVWRFVYEPVDRIAGFYKHENVVASLSGPGGSTFRLFDVLTGDLLLEKRLHAPRDGILLEEGYTGGVGVAFRDVPYSQYPDLFVLTNGNTVNHIGGKDGDVKWKWVSADQGSLVLHSRIITTPSAVYLVGLAKSLAAYTLHITTLSPETGELLAEAHIPSKLSRGMSDVLVLSSPSTPAEPLVVWIQDGNIRTLALSAKLNHKPASFKGASHRLVDVGLNDYGQFVLIKPDQDAVVLGLTEDGTSLRKLWSFDGSAPASTHTESIFSGGLDKERKPYITRLYWSHVINLASVEIYASHLASGSGLLTGFSFPFDTNYYGIINHVAIDAANPKDITVLARLFLTTSTGTVQLWQHDKYQWTREESLASVRVSTFVELPEPVVTQLGEADETFLGRVLRQGRDAQNFPTYLLNFIKRFATGSYASVSSSAAASTHAASLSRDAFGFRQIIVVATDFGKVFGLDSSTGEILWDKILGLGWAAQVGGRVWPVKMFVTKTVGDGGDGPVVVLVTQRRAENSLVDTALFEFNALTGETVLEGGVRAEVLHGRDVIDGALVDSFMLPFGDGSKVIVLLDEFLQIRLFPDTEESKIKFSQVADKLHVPLLVNVPDYPGHRRVVGHQLALNPALSDNHVAYSTWTLSLPPEESVQSFVPLTRNTPVASFGKVLGNRTTMYKYLNPRLAVVLTTTTTSSSSSDPSRCGLYVVDTVKGSILYHVDLPSSRGVCDVKATLTENWLVYHYFDEEFAGPGATKGYRVVSVEFYEGKQVDDKTKSSELSSFDPKILELTAFERAYLTSGSITALATTSTKYGITGKDLIVARKNNHIQSFSRRFLNPRRPNRKPTPEEQEEMLIPYDPLLPDDPRRLLSHNYPVANVQRITTAPALLESTSLVFAHGLDLFLTRVAPSNTFDVLSENFNKAQLVLTVMGLAFAILITKPMVRRKRLREKWYQ